MTTKRKSPLRKKSSAVASKPSKSSKPNTASLSRKEIRRALWLEMNRACGYCGIALSFEDMEVDHIKPILRGVSDRKLAIRPRMAARKGEDVVENMMCSCRRCNRWKAHYSLEEFRKTVAGRVNSLRKANPTFRLIEDFGFIEITQPPIVQFYFEKL